MVRFPPAIPGDSKTKPILARSSLNKTVYIRSVTVSDPNRLVAKIVKNKLDPLKNEEIINITTIPFNQINSFLKMRNSLIISHFMNNNFRAPIALDSRHRRPSLTYFDVIAWQVEQKEWENRQTSRSTDTTSVITIETNTISNITIPVRTVITKPSLLTIEKYDFGKVEVETERRGTITIHNPSPNPIEVSFFIAPSNFLEWILERLLMDEKLIKWKQL